MTPQEFSEIFNKEVKTTLRVMRAFPADQIEFKPHHRSGSAKQLMRVFVFEMFLDEYGFDGAPGQTSSGYWEKFKDYDPQTAQQLIQDFEKYADEIAKKIAHSTEEEFSKIINFADKEYSLQSFLLMMLFDQIHHRGQLSVYVRLAGGKVPSIYGPSADDESSNL